MVRVGYAGFVRTVQFSQSSTPGPRFFESHNLAQSALNCFNLTSGWANNEIALSDGWYLSHLLLPRKSI